MCTPTQCRYLSHLSHLLVAVDDEGTVRMVGPERSRPLGYEASALGGKPLSSIVSAGDRPTLSRLLARAQDGTPVWGQVTFLSSDGRAEPLLCCFQPIAGADLPRRAMLISGLRLASVESDLRAEAAAALGRVAFRCHAPAHRLMQSVEAILAEYPDSQAAGRCRDDLDALLEALSQASAWPRDLGLGRPVDLCRVLDAAIRLVDGDPQFQHLDVSVRADCSAAWADVHPAGLAFVVLHLVSGACNATSDSPSPHMLISISAQAGQVTLEFHDNGPGLDLNDKAMLFAPISMAGGYGGPAMATCRELVEFMGGKIRVQSSRTHGTTIVLTFAESPAPA